MSKLVFVLFSLPLPDLHSFPTRRSSDLDPIPDAEGAFRPQRVQSLMTCPLDRSEEHTSELQSPCNLVCRPLLEKTKRFAGDHVNKTRRRSAGAGLRNRYGTHRPRGDASL